MRKRRQRGRGGNAAMYQNVGQMRWMSKNGDAVRTTAIAMEASLLVSLPHQIAKLILVVRSRPQQYHETTHDLLAQGIFCKGLDGSGAALSNDKR